MVLITVAMLYIISLRLVYFITGSLYLLIPFTHFTHPSLSFLEIIFFSSLNILKTFDLKYFSKELPDGPVVRTPRSHCQRHRFNPWSGN